MSGKTLRVLKGVSGLLSVINGAHNDWFRVPRKNAQVSVQTRRSGILGHMQLRQTSAEISDIVCSPSVRAHACGASAFALLFSSTKMAFLMVTNTLLTFCLVMSISKCTTKRLIL